MDHRWYPSFLPQVMTVIVYRHISHIYIIYDYNMFRFPSCPYNSPIRYMITCAIPATPLWFSKKMIYIAWYWLLRYPNWPQLASGESHTHNVRRCQAHQKKHFSSAIPIENHPVALVQSRVYFIAVSIWRKYCMIINSQTWKWFCGFQQMSFKHCHIICDRDMDGMWQGCSATLC